MLQFSETEVAISSTLITPQNDDNNHFEIPSNCLMVFKTKNEIVIDFEIKRGCCGQSPSNIRFGEI